MPVLLDANLGHVTLQMRDEPINELTVLLRNRQITDKCSIRQPFKVFLHASRYGRRLYKDYRFTLPYTCGE